MPSCWDVQGQPSWIQAGAGSLGSLQHSSSGLGKKSQAVPTSLSVKYLGKRGGDLFKMQISVGEYIVFWFVPQYFMKLNELTVN